MLFPQGRWLHGQNGTGKIMHRIISCDAAGTDRSIIFSDDEDNQRFLEIMQRVKQR